MDEVSCPTCDNSYSRIGNHWGNGCPYPEITNRQWDILIGSLMGDATVNTQGTNPLVEINSTNVRFLKWVDNELGVLSAGVRLRNQEKGRRDYFGVVTRRHPELEELAGWYSSGKKKFPDSLQATPLVAKLWYVTDGGIEWQQQKYAYAGIKAMNEEARPDFLESLFELETSWSANMVRFGKQTDEFLEFIGEPIPGFEYKWETDSYERYKYLKRQAYTVDE